MSNPLGITYSMRPLPLMPIMAIAALVYPVGGFTAPAEDGACVVVAVQRKRNAKGEVIQEYLTVPLGVRKPSLTVLCEFLSAQLFDTCYVQRRPADLFRLVSQRLTGRLLRSVPDEWTDPALIALSNEVLRKAPVAAPAEFLADCEQHAQMRKAFACALAGLGQVMGRGTLEAGPAGRVLKQPWHRHWDRADVEPNLGQLGEIAAS